MSPEELAYCRAIEDSFARLRGTPFLLSPKDFALIRKWWAQGVPLAAVITGMAEVFERRRVAGGDPVSSLTFCRHAVVREAKRLAASAVGAQRDGAPPTCDVKGALDRLGVQVREVVERWRDHSSVAGALATLERAIATIPDDAPMDAVAETLARLETAALETLAGVLPADARARVDEAVGCETAGLQLDGAVRARTERALRLRAMRAEVGLPRLDLEPDGA